MGAPEIHKHGTDDGWHGVIEEGGEFPPEKHRYHLYIGLFCPFAHRTNLVRHIKHLTDIISLSVVRPYPKEPNGWSFPDSNEEYPNATVDHLFGSKFLREVYFKDDKDYKGKYSVPALWDKKTGRIVSNESAEILRWLPTAFNSLLPPEIAKIDLSPQSLRAQIDDITPWLQGDINTGVYKAGFARTQEGYEAGVIPLFAALNKLEALVAKNGGPFILGKQMTELDLRAYGTIVRFDVVYVQHFKTNLGTIRHDYPVLNNWLKNVYWNVEGFKESTDFKHIKENYTKSHKEINPLAITPLGPFPNVEEGYEADWTQLKPGAVTHPAVMEAMSQL
ncbi:glutathione S-transferas-like protein [Trematosphaeria pertusa]|uniref:Glutathione S-transferas-like protein n=1 Tax=Trematosphaeria pertusa TaxID=390896 RepID=A0A6A6IMJ5_9PLEO|nr:glutathione S-transferas-like protein [Trematosphaeria pertusa]KAF2251784.1 glutathione S-transferas-like protein [Trematosphaeria pertusa]